jgi:hypothetical protein
MIRSQNVETRATEASWSRFHCMITGVQSCLLTEVDIPQDDNALYIDSSPMDGSGSMPSFSEDRTD